MAARFITLEGGEGAGKTTLIKTLAQELEAEGDVVLATREPGEGPFGARIRTLLLDSGQVDPKAELFLFLADRAHHVAHVIRPALAAGQTVLCDRFTDSTFVYQAICRGLDPSFVESANAFATGGLVPDLTLLLDIDPRIGLPRVTEKNRLDNESLGFHEKVRAGFLHLAAQEKGRIKVIDASQPAEAVLNCAKNLVAAAR